MKRITHYILFLLLLTAGSCKKYLDINTNPNQPTQPTINGLLTTVTQNSAQNVYRVSTNATSYYVQYLASSNTASPTDIYEDIDLSDTWTYLYDNMTDIYDLDRIAQERGATQYQGVAKILMAINLSLVHSLWGDAPFTTAFSAETLTPSYDNAQSIYESILGLLDQGIELLQQGNSAITIPDSGPSPDLVHQGDTDAWIRTAHALKARALNLLSKTGDYNPSAIFAELAAAYTSTDQDAYITVFQGVDNNEVYNPWHQVALNNADLLLDGWLSENFINAMNGTTYGIFDPRLPFMTDTTKFGDYRGTRNGKGRTGSGVNFDETYINLTGYYSSPSSPFYFITYEELKFIEAEVALATNDKDRPYAAYLEGITANMDKIGVAPADRDAYINDPSVSVGAANITMELIFKEKYKALFLSPETWNDARRSDYLYEGFQLPLNVVTSDFVRRLVYPSIETSRNSSNVPSVSGVEQKLWWDQ